MLNLRVTNAVISLFLCISCLLIFPGSALAMPLLTAVNYPAGNGPYGVAVGDFNSEGKLDLAVANYNSNNVSILLNKGDGTFNAAMYYPVGAGPTDIAAGDFNSDGKLDLAVASNKIHDVSILIGNGNGTFSAATNYAVGCTQWSITTGDFNSDGNLDLAVTGGGGVHILLNKGDGTFNAAVSFGADISPFGITTGDFNSDGNLDLAVGNDLTSNVSILAGRGDGTFSPATNYAVGIRPRSITTGDFNSDGNLDLAVNNSGNDNVSILLNKGDGTFNATVNYPVGVGPSGNAAGDFNSDGKLDLAVANYAGSNASILLNKGDGTFNTAVNYPVGSLPAGTAVGDFNRDGAADLAVANNGSSNTSILLNTTPAPAITNVSPNTGNPGQTLSSVTITGANLLSASAVNFGSGITVNSFTVNSAAQITANITIDPSAVAGARNISVTTPGGTATLKGGFIVVQQNQVIGIGGPTSHGGSSVSVPTSQVPPVSLPNIQIQSASLSAEAVTPGIPITVTVDIANKSAVNGNKKITLYVNGQVETTQGVTMNSGGSSKLTFNISRSAPGDYSVYVDGVPAGSFKVELLRESDGILIFSVTILAIAFLIGMVMLWRRQRTGPLLILM